jgi:hypothetical protein
MRSPYPRPPQESCAVPWHTAVPGAPPRSSSPSARWAPQTGTQINDRLTTLDRATGQDDEPGLLDALPILGDILAGAPASLQARLFAAFGLELIYNKEDHQVSIYATITPSTPDALADIIAGSEPPATPDGLAHLPQHPRR